MADFKRWARAIAKPDFPVAVGPQTTISFGTFVLFFAIMLLRSNIEEYFVIPSPP
jgi:hypothetical protein